MLAMQALTGTSGVTVDGSTLSLDGTDTNLTMTANNAGDKTPSISLVTPVVVVD